MLTQKGKQNKNKTEKITQNITNKKSVYVWTLEGVFDVEIDKTHTHTRTHARTHTHARTNNNITQGMLLLGITINDCFNRDSDWCWCVCSWFGVGDIIEEAYLTNTSIFHTTLKLFKFDCEITLETVPWTNQYKAMRLKFLAQGNNGSLWWGSNLRLKAYESDLLPTAPHLL